MGVEHKLVAVKFKLRISRRCRDSSKKAADTKALTPGHNRANPKNMRKHVVLEKKYGINYRIDVNNSVVEARKHAERCQ